MNNEFDELINRALSEDIQSGDVTTSATVTGVVTGKGEFLIKHDGIIAGLDIVERLFCIVDPKLKFSRFTTDGQQVKAGTIIAEVEGSAASILTGERTALNFLQRMSGIATMCGDFSKIIAHTKAQILDTRKTVPGLRKIDKLAVKIGGCRNHRIGLFDMFLIKDNHIAVAGSVTKAINACKNYRSKNNLNIKIEVETANLAEVKQALECEADIIMLDNFSLNEMKKAVEMIGDKCKTEASGGIDIGTIRSIAETGVDYISIGALTHSVKALDISLNITTSSKS